LIALGEELQLHCAGFPKHYTLKNFKKLLAGLELDFVRVKKIPALSFGYVTLKVRSPANFDHLHRRFVQDKVAYEKALQLLPGSIEGKKLVVTKSMKGEKRVRDTDTSSYVFTALFPRLLTFRPQIQSHPHIHSESGKRQKYRTLRTSQKHRKNRLLMSCLT